MATQRELLFRDVLDGFGRLERNRAHRNFELRAGFEATGRAHSPVELPPAIELPFLTRTPRTPGQPTRLKPELGIDVGCVLDTDEAWSLVSGETNLAHALARRLSTPRGGLFYAPNYGLDLRSYLGKDVTDAEMATLGPAIEDECEKDERVQSCAVDLEFAFVTGVLTVKISVATAVGPFDLVLKASALSVELLSVTGG